MAQINTGIFIAKKLSGLGQRGMTRRIVLIAAASVAVSMVVMLLSIGIVKGFQQEIKEKVTGFDGHLLVKGMDLNQSGDLALFSNKAFSKNKLQKFSFVKSIQPVCQKPGILRTATDAEGIQCKGVGKGYTDLFIGRYLVRGKGLNCNDSFDINEVLISEVTANRLLLDTGDRVELYFIQDGQVRRRKPKICGIFNTGINEIDKSWILSDIKMVQRVYTQGYDSINSAEIFLNSLDNLENRANLVNEELGMNLTVQPVFETHYQIFQWLGLLDMNVVVIIILMVLVSVVNMITVLLVLIIDRTPMIGLLKAMGARNKLIRTVFLYNGAGYLLLGMVWGNILGLGIGFLQKYTGILKLNEETYYLDTVPFSITINEILLINGLTFAVCFLLLILPAMYVARIRPVKAIRFD